MKAVIATLLIIIVILSLVGPLSGFLESLKGDRIVSLVDSAGAWGPLFIIALMTIAVVATPIPSAPIALAAGAAYGHTLGTAYIVIGAELGALVAFCLARVLGRDMIARWLGGKVDAGWLGSQNTLTVAVFASRLMPFISFDIVSYAAGLSRLRFWRFAMATLAGIVPAGFILAHFGNEAVSTEPSRAAWAAIGLGLLTLTPLVITAFRDRRRKRARRE